ncbi:hypothetical protein SDRG_09527 [Saprolegnia diclina VS20]|uniref:Leucine zipper transcription factor-like protein 1 n=1 Tax=Saprolegnia diclina (strain VS20) TaxID=1156394 RepID=T0QH98_SAPDV|nr:hypothetical protein SDRG_09527 [Saprolegnia diclina VS20]EQC33005.1 hypothetical protein SDRG_09527 [Saprolegnia diclina VS20]|eukprot:XP_008613691.1 hypothetical protein SDRG_09527 [Saprolegnia diclina VS20]
MSTKGGMSAHHQAEISKFLKFFRSRLATHLENIEAEFDDTRSDRLSSDDMYSQKDVTDVLTSLCFAIKGNARSELQDTINMTALLLRQVFAEAEENQLRLALDTGIVEDKDMLEKVERLSVAEWAGDEKRAKKAVLPKAGRSDEEFESLEKETQSLRGRLEQLQVDCSRALKDKSRLQDDMDELRHAQTTSSGRHVDALEKELRAARQALAEYEASAKEEEDHISQTKPFLQLKKMVKDKNDLIQQLRRRLRKYEPEDDDAKAADDDDD